MTTEQLTADLAYNAAEILSAATVGSTKYEIVDVGARAGVLDNRAKIDEISSLIQGGVHYLGKTTDPLTDGSTTNPISINGKAEKVTAVDGDMVSYSPGEDKNDLEFIWGSSRWNEFGSSGALKALAFKNTASADYTPAGSVGISATTIGALDVTNASAEFNSVSVAAQLTLDNYTPVGTISCGDYTPAGEVTVNDIVVGDKKITVKEISSQAFEGTAVTATVATTTQSFDLPTGIEINQITGVTGTIVGTPATINTVLTATTGNVESTGKLSQLPALSSAGTVNAVTNVATSTATAGSASVTNGVLSFNFADVLTAATVTTSDVNVTVTSGYKSTLTSVADIDLTVTGTALTSVTPGSTSYTPAGSVTVDTIEPTGSLKTTSTALTATGNTGDIIAAGNVTFKTKDVEKTVSIGTLTPTASFKGTDATLEAKFTGTAKAPTGSVSTTEFTPSLTAFSGKVTVPEHTHSAGFGGTEATITVS